jgi:hypothetical protein
MENGVLSELGTPLSVTINWNTLRESTVRNIFQLLITANIVSSPLILFTIMMEAISSSETHVLTRATGRHITEDGIHNSHRRETPYLTASVMYLMKKQLVRRP